MIHYKSSEDQKQDQKKQKFFHIEQSWKENTQIYYQAALGAGVISQPKYSWCIVPSYCSFHKRK